MLGHLQMEITDLVEETDRLKRKIAHLERDNKLLVEEKEMSKLLAVPSSDYISEEIYKETLQLLTNERLKNEKLVGKMQLITRYVFILIFIREHNNIIFFIVI